MIKRVPRAPQRGPRRAHLGEARTKANGGDLAVEAKVLLDSVDELADLRVALKVPLDSEQSEAQAVEVVDAAAPMLVPALTEPLAVAKEVAADAGVTADALQENDDRLALMTEIYDIFSGAESQVTLSVRLMAKVQRGAHEAVDAAMAAFLADPQVPEAAKQEVRVELRLIEKVREVQAVSRQAQAERTTAEREAQAAALAAEQRREQVLRTLSRLRRGGTVTPEELRAAHEAVMGSAAEDRGASAADDRRGGGR